MAAVTTDIATRTYGGQVNEETFPIATGQTIYVGTLVTAVNTTGRATGGAVALNRRFLGLAIALPDGSGVGNTAGSNRVRVQYGNVALVSIRTAARTFSNIGRNVFISTNNEVSTGAAAGTAGLRVKVGPLMRFESTDKSTGWVWLRAFGDADA